MVEVRLWSGLRSLVEGQPSVQVEAKNVGELLDQLVQTYPALGPVVQAGVSVAIDGRIIASDRTEPVRSDQEIVLMQRLRGG
jgi:molybdopterin converting factor small subunit